MLRNREEKRNTTKGERGERGNRNCAEDVGADENNGGRRWTVHIKPFS